MKRILCYGDSNTWGYDAEATIRIGVSTRFPEDVRWTGVMQQLLGPEYRVLEEGLNGRTTVFDEPGACDKNGNGFLEVALRTCSPFDLIILMLGTNDLLQGASAKEAASRMEAFLTPLLPHCNHILLIAPPPMQRGAWVPSDALTAASFQLAEEYQKLAHKRNIPFVDTRNWNIGLCFDGVHFTEEGHHTFSNCLMKYL